MPELPEVEVVRRGLAQYLPGRRITEVGVAHPRAVRTMAGGADELQARITGRDISAVRRRGKFAWLELSDPPQPGDDSLLIHLGMSGQMLVRTELDEQHTDLHSDPSASKHVRAWLRLDDDLRVDFVDQRTFGLWAAAELTPAAGMLVPQPVAHIAADLLEEDLDLGAVARRLARSHSEIKRVILNQNLISGVGNIYADEMLWAARIHPRRSADELSEAKLVELLECGQQVMRDALAQGGTSFDALYVNVNGQSGYFDRSLAAYGQTGRPCRRCGTLIIREKFTNRSSHLCPVCQPLDLS